LVRNGNAIEPLTTSTSSNSGVWTYQSSLASVMRTPMRWPAGSFQSADQRSSVFLPLERARKPWRVISGPVPFSSRS
jgi:hypothetical protein